MSYNDHEIIVNNLSDTETINYSILLVKGFVKNYRTECYLKIFLSDQRIRHSSKQKPNSYKFLTLLNLSEIGSYELKLTCCTIDRFIRINRVENLNPHRLIPLYVVADGHDGNFQSDQRDNSIENGCERIQLGLHLVQSLFAEKNFEVFSERKTFNLMRCTPFYSRLKLTEAETWDEQRLWNFFVREIFSRGSVDHGKDKFVLFLSCTRYDGEVGMEYKYEEIFKRVKCNPAISVGGLALLGTGCLYSWSSRLEDVSDGLTDKRVVDISKFLDNSNYRRTYGGCFSTTLGSVCHEIGHIFDLGHTKDGIMGNDIDFIGRVFSLEYKTECLPNRLVSTIAKDVPESSRFTKIKQPGKYLNEYHRQKDNDLSYFSGNCAITLNYHKWMNVGNVNGSEKISYENGVISSGAFPLKLVEIRELNSEMLIKYWLFEDNLAKNFEISSKYRRHCVIFAINENGDVFKTTV